MPEFVKTDAPSITPWKAIAIVAAVASAGLAYVAFKYEMKEITKAEESGRWPAKRFSQVWIGAPGGYSGARVEGGTIQLERRQGEGWKSVAIDTGLSSIEGKVRLNRDGSLAAWRAGQSVGIWTGKSGAVSRVPARAVDFDFVDDSTLVTLAKDGTLEWWDASSQAKLKSRKIVNGVSSAAIARGSLVVIDSGRALVRGYTFGPDFRTTLIEEARALPAPFEVGVGGPGQAVFTRRGEVAVRGQVHGLPGSAVCVTPGLRGEILITGEFEGVLALGKKGKPEAMLAALPGTVSDATESELLVSGPDGTRSFAIASDWAFTPRGRTLAWASILALLKSICMALAKHLKKMVVSLFRRSAKNSGKAKKRNKRKLPAVTPDLLESFARGEVALWAGSGLSAQAGLATRTAFVKSTLEVAYAEEWAKPSEVAKLLSLPEQGRAEEALEKLIGLMGPRRQMLFEQIRCTYLRPVKSSGAHAAIGRLPFASAISTNYDILLDCVAPQWANSIHLKSSERALSRAQDMFFLVKLYGDMAAPESVLSSRSELQAAAAAQPKVKGLLESLLVGRRMVFVGCSITQLHADLTALNAPKLAAGVKTTRHVCLAASDGADWERKAQELRSWWGIEVVECDDDVIGAQLYEWLEGAAREYEKMYQSRLADKAKQMAEAVAIGEDQ